ncbi:unnamed protein product [Ostreobium quekettii]|uniref:Uncharacterized protein n=1 Tax=Ostreobium quekettii TaxID=121088 RepID=A0A8S1J690_9CHLO|nr:unnamed protein product [Ostreobium quekettii]
MPLFSLGLCQIAVGAQRTLTAKMTERLHIPGIVCDKVWRGDCLGVNVCDPVPCVRRPSVPWQGHERPGMPARAAKYALLASGLALSDWANMLKLFVHSVAHPRRLDMW